MPTVEGRHLAGPAIRTFENIADRWGLRTAERMALLGNMPSSTYYRVRRKPDGAELASDTLERISHILGIYKALHVLFSSDEYADRWISEPNAAFGGTPAKERIMRGFTELVEVRRYLDAQRGW
jgi:uncharacterized protein (DUF2384 family)